MSLCMSRRLCIAEFKILLLLPHLLVVAVDNCVCMQATYKAVKSLWENKDKQQQQQQPAHAPGCTAAGTSTSTASAGASTATGPGSPLPAFAAKVPLRTRPPLGTLCESHTSDETGLRQTKARSSL